MSKEERRIRTDVIVRALRCTATPGGRCFGDKCPYRTTEKAPAEMREQVGGDEWDSCDVDAIGIAAADRLEELLELNKRKNARWRTWASPCRRGRMIDDNIMSAAAALEQMSNAGGKDDA